MHFPVVLDVGIDYGASGGLAWDTTVLQLRRGGSRRNQNWSVPLGRWQLGNRTVDGATKDYLQGFFHAVRGQAHTFLFLDWTDYRATQEQLVVAGDESQLIKTYGIDINAWVREIRAPKASSVVIEMLDGSAWVELEEGEDYTLEDDGVVTWLNDPATSDQLRWSGDFYVPARFEVDQFDCQFLGLERRVDTDYLAYSLGGLPIVEEPE